MRGECPKTRLCSFFQKAFYDLDNRFLTSSLLCLILYGMRGCIGEEKELRIKEGW